MKMKTIRILICVIMAAIIALVGVFLYQRAQVSFHDVEETAATELGYRSITMEEAQGLFEAGGSYVIVDVRREDEFASGHIPGAINIPNESIGQKHPEQLPDKTQTIYVYCRSGNRSKQASEKLAALGYRDIVEFGGILDWNGDIEK